ncbi:MAG: Ribose-phosphate pyrophosphokinase [Candidatus Aminicenantes bacterium ADurb.Bin508]|nr:MAG: Ribose-phosphate pyrophosphokinase [Candidatus Aminicenantes bacterium ADurb.Bin508]HNX40926.1 ribose-phosphate pyrophosphokinase [Candidatus Aminicenantes bacterium]HPB54510.1 ribose-phosphate pyrophosphokinase [Candidatus Aminicenantes bacterium]HPS99010.1 ribose-phosphate pyrophosphokinase [Candidatus Aminicenantes bacterium]
MKSSKMKMFAGSSNPALAKAISEYIDLPLGKQILKVFSDGEIRYQILENVRGADLFIFQSLSRDVNYHIMELLIMGDAARRASAGRLTALIPYFGYARQDRKDRPRVPISSRLVADIIIASGFDRVLTVDLHAPQIQGFFNIPMDNLMAAPILIEHIKRMKIKEEMVIVSPDAGGVERARFFAENLNAYLAIVDKRRYEPNKAELRHIIGKVENKVALIVDDIVDTAGTLCNTVQALLERGAVKVYAASVHPVLSGPAIERISASGLEKLFTTDTIPLSEEARKCGKIEVLSIAPLLGEAIRGINEETSVSRLFL